MFFKKLEKGIILFPLLGVILYPPPLSCSERKFTIYAMNLTFRNKGKIASGENYSQQRKIYLQKKDPSRQNLVVKKVEAGERIIQCF